jgi:hypothetical protein
MSVETTATAARERAEAIRSGIDAIADALQKIPPLIIAAREAEDWKTLGYDSWKDYVTGEFGTSFIKLTKGTRKEWTLALADAGLSTREIAPVVNVGKTQVQRDLAAPKGAARSPEERLSGELHAVMHRLGKARDMMRKGAAANSQAQLALQEVVRLVQEILNTGAEREAR